MPQPCNEIPPAARKKAIRKRVSADAFSRRDFLSLRVLLFRPFGIGGLILPFERLRFGLFLGVSLSAAARSPAALVYDKLTPNCHPVLEGYMKIGSHFISGCLYVCMKFCGISEFAVQRIVPLPNARFPVVYRASADSQFRAYFCLPHAVHIAI